jgi:hypothetical protein
MVRFYFQCGQDHLAFKEVRRMQAKGYVLERATQEALQKFKPFETYGQDEGILLLDTIFADTPEKY